MNIATITDFINRYVAAFEKIALKDFLIKFQEQFYPELDISFMDYFLELSKEEYEGQFVVHHHKLFEYGITKSGRSSDVNDRLNALNMIENEDYTLRKLPQRNKNGRGSAMKNIYMLTPEAFKTILIGATRHSSHTEDVLKYRKYYLFLEKVVGYYMKYQLMMEQAASNAKDITIGKQSDKIDSLISEVKDQTKKMDDQSKKIDNLTTMNVNQSEQISRLLITPKTTKLRYLCYTRRLILYSTSCCHLRE